MNYVKNYAVGQMNFDFDTNAYIHELPLLSFGDVQHDIVISLLHRTDITGNPFYISDGYKLNIQKRIIFPADGTPSFFEDGQGKVCALTAFNAQTYDIFTFNDASKRILKKTGNEYLLEYPDYSKETYDASGRIIAAYDKYNECYLTFGYSANKLSLVNYRGNKTININYTNNKISSISYNCVADNNNVVYTSSFVYGIDGNLQKVLHYSGVDYCYSIIVSPDSGFNFEVYSTNHGQLFSNDYSHKITARTLEYPENGYLLSYIIGNKLIDRQKYDTSVLCDGKYHFLDISDINGVKKRIQYENGLPAYSYEVSDEMFVEHLNNYLYKGNVNIHNNNKIDGTLAFSDGTKMNYEYAMNQWYYWFNKNDSNSNNYYFVLTGWLKPLESDTSCIVKIRDTSRNINVNVPISGLSSDKWRFFAIKLNNYNLKKLIVEFDIGEDVESRDLRLSFQQPDLVDEEDNCRLTNIEDVIFCPDTSLTPIPFSEIEFYNGNTKIEQTITHDDVVKYYVNQTKGSFINEIYYNDCRGVIPDAESLLAKYNNGYYMLTNACVGRRYLCGNKETITKIIKNPVSDYNNAFLNSETYCAGELVSVQTYDDKFNLIYSVEDSVSTFFGRNSKGLITSKIINNSIFNSATYDDTNSKCLTTTDEYCVTTSYITDDVWGTVISATLEDGTKVENTYDSDNATLLSKAFSKGTAIKSHVFGYSNGNLTELSQGGLNYGFGYTKENLTEVKKSGSIIESHSFTNNNKEVLSSYPSATNPLYSVESKADNYGRLTEITGILKNTYDIDPKYHNGNYTVSSIDNASGKLAENEDLISGNKRKYAYEFNRLTKIGEFNSSNTQISEERFGYDAIGRLVSDEYVYNYNHQEQDSIKEDIVYERSADSVVADNRIKSYSFKVNGAEKANTQNEYSDAYKRLTKKQIRVNGRVYEKDIVYDKTRISRVTDKNNGSTSRNITYLYDTHGRIIKETDSVTNKEKRYEYDSFGQLVRENNKEIDKTIVYEYNEIGNIVRKSTYDYTTGTVGVKRAEDIYGYDSVKKDLLIALNGNALTYDSNGCMKTAPSTLEGITGTINYGWTNGRLTSITGLTSIYGSSSYTYTYNGIGQRTQKIESRITLGASMPLQTTVTTGYIYDNSGRLIREIKVGSSSLGAISTTEKVYLYDESGVIGMVYTLNGTSTTYYFDKNVYGDIVGIIDESGNVAVRYSYDAYGKCTITATNTVIAKENPFRYRGYYYDVETNLALVSSRYYSPELGRFIQPADVSSLNPQSINGLNLYTYAVNNPISIKYDSSVSSYGSGMVSSIDFGALSTGTSSISNQVAPEWLKLLVGAIPDLKVGLDYLTAHGTKSSFAYATAKTYRFPILGGTHSAFTKGKYSYGDLVGASFRKITTDSARGGFGAFAKNFAKTSVYTLGVNFAFNLYENNWQIDDAMIQDTLIDTAIGVSSYYMAAGTMSLLTAGALVAFGWNVPGLIVVGGVVVLSIAYDALIRWITGYDE